MLSRLSSQLHEVAALASRPEQLDRLLVGALHALHDVIPYDLAALYLLDGNTLRAHVAEGRLATPAVLQHRLRLTDFPTVRRALATGRPIALTSHDHDSDEGDPYDGVLDLPVGHSCMVVPLVAGTRPVGLITLDRTTCAVYPSDHVELAGVFGQVVSTAIAFAEQAALLDRYRHRLKEQVSVLESQQADGLDAVAALEASSAPAMRAVVQQLRIAARSDAPILLLGETGTGKEVVSRAIHAWSPRAPAPFVKLNCAAIPAALVESELFGHVIGAFSGAVSSRQGRFATADGGTLLLDELGEMPLGSQARLLRVLQDGTFQPVGSDRTIKVDVRVVAATNADLLDAVQRGTFREDLYYRLAVFPVSIPPLRERRDDIVPIAERWLDARAQRSQRGPWTLSADARATLQGSLWPGNVRQLVNMLERATILQASGTIHPTHLGLPPAIAPVDEAPYARVPSTFAEAETRYFQHLLAHTKGRIYGENGAAILANLKPTTLQSKLKKRGLK